MTENNWAMPSKLFVKCISKRTNTVVRKKGTSNASSAASRGRFRLGVSGVVGSLLVCAAHDGFGPMGGVCSMAMGTGSQ